MDFRLQAKHVMCTWSCPVTVDEHPIPSKDVLLEHIKTLRDITGAVVCKELHENGKPHYHAYLFFQNKLTCRNAAFFDVLGVHPNIGSHGTARSMVGYVIKGGDYVAWNIDVDKIMGVNTKAKKKDSLYADALDAASEGDLKKAKALLRAGDPQRYAISHMQIMGALNSVYMETLAERNPVVIKKDGWVTDAKDIDLKHKNLGEGYHRTHVLVGAAGIGKTQLAKYLLHKAGCIKIHVIRDVEQLKDVIDDCDGFVFDELNAAADDGGKKKWSREDQIALVDREECGTLPARFKNVVLKPHVIRIITTNTLHRALLFADEAIARRITVHDLGAIRLF